MTVLNTGSNNKFSANWEGIFAKGKAKKSGSAAKKAVVKKSAAKKKPAAKKK